MYSKKIPIVCICQTGIEVSFFYIYCNDLLTQWTKDINKFFEVYNLFTTQYISAMSIGRIYIANLEGRNFAMRINTLEL